MKNVTFTILLTGLFVATWSAPPVLAQTAGGYRFSPKAPALKLTAVGGLDLAGNDFTSSSRLGRAEFTGGLNIGFLVRRNFLLGLDYATGGMKTDKDGVVAKNTFHSFLVRAEGRLPIPRSRFVLYGFAHGGLLIFKPDLTTSPGSALQVPYIEGTTLAAFAYGIGVGSEVLISRRVSFQIETGLSTTTSDKLDGFVSGSKKDGWSYLSLGFSWYIPFPGAK